jgi:hypothetical protein
MEQNDLYFSFEFLSFGIRICFGFRYSDFEFNISFKEWKFDIRANDAKAYKQRIKKY